MEIHVTLKGKELEIHFFDENCDAHFTIPREQLGKLVKDLENIRALWEMEER